MISWLKRRFSARAIGLGIIVGGIIHIAWTLSLPYVEADSSYQRLAGAFPVNTMHLLAPTSPGRQAIPYLAPDTRHAICPFDLATGQLEISVRLPEPGWALSLLAADGGVFYSVGGEHGKAQDLSLTLVRPAERYFGFWPQSRSLSMNPNELQAPDKSGLLVLTAPLNGVAFGAAAEAMLRQSSCRLRDD